MEAMITKCKKTAASAENRLDTGTEQGYQTLHYAQNVLKNLKLLTCQQKRNGANLSE